MVKYLEEKEQLIKILLKNEQKHYDYLSIIFKKHFNALRH